MKRIDCCLFGALLLPIKFNSLFNSTKLIEGYIVQGIAILANECLES